MDIIYVISLGHKAKQPLICSSSELVDGLEPTAVSWLPWCTGDRATATAGGEGCTRGGAELGWLGGTIPGTPPSQLRGRFDAYLTLYIE